eukprot:scaffold119513_cov25-Prasinocladus_malaysianus.AAC.1
MSHPPAQQLSGDYPYSYSYPWSLVAYRSRYRSSAPLGAAAGTSKYGTITVQIKYEYAYDKGE